jgi:hypothetical protein
MPLDRFLRLLLLLFLPASSLGLAGGRHQLQPQTSASQTVGPGISGPAQSLPTPVHDEATCPFCQAAIFPPCAPAAVSVPPALLGTVREDHVATDALVFHSTAHRLADSRAPPALRIV